MPPSSSVVPVHIQRHGFALNPRLPEIRARPPVARVRLPSGAVAWLVTRHDDVREVLSDAERFGSDGRSPADPDRHGDFSQYDPPDHTRLRRMVAAAFTARAVRRLQPRIEEIVSARLDDMATGGPPADLVSSFALPVPSAVICELLGVPYADRARFHEWSVLRFDGTRPGPVRTAAVNAAVGYMARLVARERAEPGQGLLGTLIREHGEEVDDRELAGIGDLLLLGGHETTSNVLALGSLLLLRNPGHRDALTDPERLSGFVEELLRYLCVVQTGVPRIARRDTVLAGRTIRRGERLLCSLPSANRDEHAVSDPETFDPARGSGNHLAFGHGIHYCLGAPLARAELRIALPALFERFPALRVNAPPGGLSFRASSAIYGIREVPVAW